MLRCDEDNQLVRPKESCIGTDNCVLIVLLPSGFTFSQIEACSQRRRTILVFSLLVFIAKQRGKGSICLSALVTPELALPLGSRLLPREQVLVTKLVVSMVPILKTEGHYRLAARSFLQG